MSEEQGHELYADLLRDYGSWFGEVVRMAFYNTDVTERSAVKVLSAVTILTPVFAEQERELPQQIRDSEFYLSEKTKKLLDGSKPPSADAFQSFWQAYEGLLGLIHRLEKDALLLDSGIDPQTGLRSASVMVEDLERELERRARRGQPFSIALTRIDGIENNKNPQKIALAVETLKKTLRSFDDAYATGQGDFLVSLKHSDVNGGLKFAGRLADALKRNENIDFTMSCCVAEPMPGDNMLELVDNTRKDLKHIAELGEGASGQYEDLSPLSRFIQTMSADDSK